MAILNKLVWIILLHGKDTDGRKSVNEFRKEWKSRTLTKARASNNITPDMSSE